MQTKTDIANFALAALGAGQINSISDPGDAAILCSNWIDDAVRSTLLEGRWQATVHRTSLLPSGPGIDAWIYSYELPSDCVYLMNCLTLTPQSNAITSSSNTYIFSNQSPTYLANSTQWYLEGGTLYSNVTSMILQYVRYPDNFAGLPTKLNQAIGYALALLVGPGLSVDAGRVGMVQALYNDAVGKAGRFEKRDRTYQITRRQWGDPS